MIAAIDDEDAIMIVVDSNAFRMYELAWLVPARAEFGHERAVVTREYLLSMIDAVDNE